MKGSGRMLPAGDSHENIAGLKIQTKFAGPMLCLPLLVQTAGKEGINDCRLLRMPAERPSF